VNIAEDEISMTVHYSRAMDVVNLLNAGQGDLPNEYWLDRVQRAVAALRHFLDEFDWPEEFDLTPIQTCISTYG